MGEHFHLEFLWEWAAGSATLNHSILRIQTFLPCLQSVACAQKPKPLFGSQEPKAGAE